MKRLYLLFTVSFFFLSNSFAQLNIEQRNKNFDKLSHYEIQAPNIYQLQKEDLQRDNNGELYRIGVGSDVSYTPENSGQWETLPNGDKKWVIRLHSPGAQALSVLFDKFIVYGKSYVQVFDPKGNILSDKFGVEENQEHLMQHIALNKSDDIIVMLYSASDDKPAEISIYQVAYIYRGVNKYNEKSAGSSQSCQNNINCPVGNNWQDDKKGVARILIKDGNNYGYCTGSLVNNTGKNCKPYFLTAHHCGVNTSSSDLNQWKFYFNFETATCNGTPNENIANNNNTITGCVRRASSNDGGGNTGSDFLLLQLGSNSNEAQTINKLKSNAINAYWNGWDANNTPVSSGVGIHHPSGDVKKISVFNSQIISSSWGSGNQSHWFMRWSNGVTEGGSSGSPLFNNNHRIIGTLTGGSSFCNSPNDPDLYGKMSYHWEQNTSQGSDKLKTFLDPTNSGAKTIDGSYDPCDPGDTNPNPDPNSPCESTSQNCDEYIKEVKLHTLSNASGCNNYTFYPGKTTQLQAGQSYTIEITTDVIGSQSSMYYDDHVLAWIDYNNDLTFSQNEKIFDQLVTQASPGYTPTATFTVPQNAVQGDVYLRVKIGYQDNNSCGTYEYGETEDYKIKIIPKGTSLIAENQFANLSIYPNPAKDILYFDGNESGNESCHIQVIDLMGKVILSETVAQIDKHEINVRQLAKGMYQVKVVQGNSVGLFKFVKE